MDKSKTLIVIWLTKKCDLGDVQKALERFSNHQSFYLTASPFSQYLAEKLELPSIPISKIFTPIEMKKLSSKCRSEIFTLLNSRKNYWQGFSYELGLILSLFVVNKTIQESINRIKGDSSGYLLHDHEETDLSFDNLKLNNSIFSSFNLEEIIVKPVSVKIKRKNFTSLSLSRFLMRIFFPKHDLRYDWFYYPTIANSLKWSLKLKIAKNHHTHSTPCIINLLKIFRTYFEECMTKEIEQLLYSHLYEIFNSDALEHRGFPKIKCSVFGNRIDTISNYHNKSIGGINIYYQHGSYLYNSYYLKNMEIYPANINIVFNNYTKELFHDLGAKNVISAGSKSHQYKIKRKSKFKYDYLYITQGHDYLGNLCYDDLEGSLRSVDGHMTYQRHKEIINMFGLRFSNMSICIKAHPLILKNGLYVPFWELAQSYPNIKIDTNTPCKNLIANSKNLIFDYFSSELTNRHLFDNFGVILLDGVSTLLPEHIKHDLNQIFYLCRSTKDLEDLVKSNGSFINPKKVTSNLLDHYISVKPMSKTELLNCINKIQCSS